MNINLSILLNDEQNLLNTSKKFKRIISYIFTNIYKDSWINVDFDIDINLNVIYKLKKIYLNNVDNEMKWIYFFFDRNIKIVLNTETKQFAISLNWNVIIFCFNKSFTKLKEIKIYKLSVLSVSSKTTIDNSFICFNNNNKVRRIARKEDKRLFMKILYLMENKKYKNFISNINNDEEENKIIKELEEELQIKDIKEKKKKLWTPTLMDINIDKMLRKIKTKKEREQYLWFIETKIYYYLKNEFPTKWIVNNLYNLIKSVKIYVLNNTEEINDKIFKTISLDIVLHWIIWEWDYSLNRYIKDIKVELNNHKKILENKNKIKETIWYVLTLHKFSLSKLIII